jgi:hypothetical protein
MYDNNTVIVENFNDEPVNVSLVGKPGMKQLTDLKTGAVVKMTESQTSVGRRGSAATSKGSFTILPHSYKAFKYE